MLQTITQYSPVSTTVFINWWYGRNKDPNKNLNESNENNSLSSLSEREQENHSDDQGKKVTESNFIHTPKKDDNLQVGISSDEEYKTGNEYYQSSRRNTTEGLHFDSINHIPLSSDDDYKTSNEQHQNTLLNSQYKLDDRVRQIILEGLSETNDEEDELPSRRKYTRSYLKNFPEISSHESHSLSRSAPTDESRSSRYYIRNIEHIYEHTDSDSSCFDSVTSKEIQKQKKQSFPFLLFNSKKKNSHRRRRALSSVSAAKREENTLILTEKTFYRTTDRTLVVNTNETQMRSLQNRHQQAAGYDEKDYPAVTVSPDQLSATYISAYGAKKRHSLSESSTQLSLCSLDSSWSEYTISLPSLEEGSECRESEDMLSSSFKHENGHHKKRPQYLAGDFVKESFLDNECFCCQCSIM